MKIEEKKKRFFVIIGIFAIIMSIYVSNYRSFLSIDDACVNPETGDISYVYFENGSNHLKTFDRDGNLLYSCDIDTNRSVVIKYDNNILCLYLYELDEQWTYGRDGKRLSVIENAPHWKFQETKEFNGWSKKIGCLWTRVDKTQYRYETSSFLLKCLIRKGENKMTICKPDGTEIVIFED